MKRRKNDEKTFFGVNSDIGIGLQKESGRNSC